MTTSKQSSSRPSISKKWIFALIFLSFVGFAVSGFLTAEHYMGEIPPCSVVKGCEEVTTSKYSTIGPFPLSLLGLGYFTVLLVILVAYVDMKKAAILKLFALFTIPGALMSLVLIWLQFSVIRAFCIYCLAADISVLLITISAIFLYLTFLRSGSVTGKDESSPVE